MIYSIIYDTEFYRTIPAVMIDARAGTPLEGAVGTAIQSFTDAEVAKASAANVLTYKIESGQGNLAGYFSLLVNENQVVVYQQLFRPAYNDFFSDIAVEINNFVTSNQWSFDFM